MTAPVDAWSSDWADLKKRNRRAWYYFLGLAGLLFASHALGFSGFSAIMLIGPVILWIAVEHWRIGDFQCPRCGEKFFIKHVWGVFKRHYYYRLTCLHCGLEKFTPSYKAKPFNKITNDWDRLF